MPRWSPKQAQIYFSPDTRTFKYVATTTEGLKRSRDARRLGDCGDAECRWSLAFLGMGPNFADQDCWALSSFAIPLHHHPPPTHLPHANDKTLKRVKTATRLQPLFRHVVFRIACNTSKNCANVEFAPSRWRRAWPFAGPCCCPIAASAPSSHRPLHITMPKPPSPAPR